MPILSIFISGMCLATLIFISVQFFRLGGSLNPMRNDATQNYVLIAMINLCVSYPDAIPKPNCYAHHLRRINYGFGGCDYRFPGCR